MSDAHAPIAPSSLYRTVACPGWILQASKLPPETETEATLEGDAGHWVALAMAVGTVPALGSIAPNGVEITEEMIDGGYLWVEAMESYPARHERRVLIPRIHPSDCWGTPDRDQYAPETRTLRIADYKFGHGYVEVFENWQLLSYAAGVMQERGLLDTETVLELMLVQPRCYHPDGPVRTWTVAAVNIRALINDASMAAHEAVGPNPETHSGPHCLHCPARATCPTFQKAVANIVEFSGRADPMMQGPGDVGRELQLITTAIKRLEARETGLRALAESMIHQGKPVPFWTLQQTPGRLKWDEGATEDIAMLARLAGKSAFKAPELITPTQAKQRKILPDAIVSAYSTRPNGALKLAPDSTTKASRIFQK